MRLMPRSICFFMQNDRNVTHNIIKPSAYALVRQLTEQTIDSDLSPIDPFRGHFADCLILAHHCYVVPLRVHSWYTAKHINTSLLSVSFPTAVEAALISSARVFQSKLKLTIHNFAFAAEAKLRDADECEWSDVIIIFEMAERASNVFFDFFTERACTRRCCARLTRYTACSTITKSCIDKTTRSERRANGARHEAVAVVARALHLTTRRQHVCLPPL